MKTRLTIPWLIAVLAGSVIIAIDVLADVNLEQVKREHRAENRILHYLDSTGIEITPGSDEYQTFMRMIVWGEVPDLTGNNSTLQSYPEELNYILDYAWKYSGYEEMYGIYAEPEVNEALPGESDP